MTHETDAGQGSGGGADWERTGGGLFGVKRERVVERAAGSVAGPPDERALRPPDPIQ